MEYSAAITKIPRKFLPEDFKVTDWESLEPYFKELLDRPINSVQEMQDWLQDLSELEAVVGEDAAWRQIRMTCDTENKELEEAFNYFVLEIDPKIRPYADKLNRKLVDSPYTKELDQKEYFTYLRNVKKSIDLFREENIPILAEIAVQAQQFGVINGKMTVEVDGKEYTLQQAAKFLESPHRELREEVYRKIQERRLQDKDKLNDLFSSLVQKRHQVALNAGFENYRDYKFADLGRFDYKKEDCFQFHHAVKTHVQPLVDYIYDRKRQKLGLDALRPWDVDAEPEGILPLTPFRNGEDLTFKTIECFRQMNPFFADCLIKMKEMGRLDLDSRKGKAPGGYNCPLPETGAPFIFMNAAGQMHDVTTMVHEGGHAIHSFLAHHLPLTAFKDYPMEIAEVASMTMELFSMEYWDVFFDDEEDLRRAKEHQMERVLTIFPWIATIDKFQHWVYEHPDHTLEERAENWRSILNEFTSIAMDVSGLENYRRYGWQRQLHLFEVPFYYIEYGIAQLGAIGLWKQFKENKEKAVQNYLNALQLGGTRTLPELYEAAGLQFNFSPDYISELMIFVKEEMEKFTHPKS
ncbi:M3 family oligoendopeptidase [Chitinophagaceae bacterium LB-8]|uniref:M3 family oligoendopeptidase n=1 Tax=Paraflavisolibacter caeni TaxID=2982496 RepID=A0A9X2Y0X2_9BACT|nr:M3 family oligoendopeptidase [Paraflavisolibacter caeni]MCU7552392.1 M3 family oligoendopeptidase [Paraflavisolibacter caeni]